jgi:hypothetical protein
MMLYAQMLLEGREDGEIVKALRHSHSLVCRLIGYCWSVYGVAFVQDTESGRLRSHAYRAHALHDNFVV